jgi:hypothetical protein
MQESQCSLPQGRSLIKACTLASGTDIWTGCVSVERDSLYCKLEDRKVKTSDSDLESVRRKRLIQ